MDVKNLIDLESAKERFMDNEMLYKRFLFEFPGRTFCQDIQSAIEAGDAEKGFEEAHKMKGVVENLSLSALGTKVHAVVETLRKGDLPDGKMMDEMLEAHAQAVEEIRRIENENITLF